MDNRSVLNFPIDDTCYFSALEEFQQHNEAYDHLNEENSFESEHYYTPLNLENMTSRTDIKM